jgi:aspartate/methionine/tyrosine aminotransferase
VVPDGAFYVWADCRRHASDSWEFCERMLRRAHVALTPGKDFGPGHAADYFRLSFAASLPELQETVHRLERELGS